MVDSGSGKGCADLPSEAQWEFACRAGTETAYWKGEGEKALAEVGWYAANAEGETHPVAEKEPNPRGLYDMHGNVQEWCLDYYDPRRYRKCLSGAEASSLEDLAQVEVAEADAIFVALAGMLARFGQGQREVGEDRDVLASLRTLAESLAEQIQFAFWRDVAVAAKVGLRLKGSWPAGAESIASNLAETFRQQVEGASGKGGRNDQRKINSSSRGAN